jgi:hypothetical protein
LHTRKQQEQKQHHWKGLGEDDRRQPGLPHERHGARISCRRNQGGGDEHQGHQHDGAGRYGLRIEEVGEDQEIGKENRHDRIAAGARFQQFQREQDSDEGDAGVTSEKRPVRIDGGAERRQHEKHQYPSSWLLHRPATFKPCQPGAPSEHHAGEGRAPCRQMIHMRQQDRQQGQKQGEHGIAADRKCAGRAIGAERFA